MIDTLTGLLMFCLAVGVVAVILISVSRVAESWVPLERALIPPAVACAVGAALVNLWSSAQGPVSGAPPSALLFIVGLFQAEWAFAVSRPSMRALALRSGLVIHGVGLLIVLAWAVAGPLTGLAQAGQEGVSGTAIVSVSLTAAVLVMIVLVLRAQAADPARPQRIAARTAVEIRSLAVAAASLMTFLALAGTSHLHG